jgi:catechol 2,3-dioxygenase-like lactoylglutathione lyase family enzyme
MIRQLHHVGILTKDVQASVRHYVETYGCAAPKIVSVEKPGLKLRTAMLQLGSSNLQLVEPEIGPGVQELHAGGEGTIFEMAFQVDDIEQFHDEMTERGITPVTLLGAPLTEKYLVANSGNRYFYLPKEKNRGTTIEVIQEIPKKAANPADSAG